MLIILLPIVLTTQHRENIWVIADKNVTPTVTLIVVVVTQDETETVIATIVVVAMTVIGIGIRMAVTAVVTGATVTVVALPAEVTHQIMVGAAAGVIHAVPTGVAALPEVVEVAAILMLPQRQPLHQVIDGKKKSSLHEARSRRFE